LQADTSACPKLLHEVSGLTRMLVTGGRIESKSAISGVVQVKVLGLDSDLVGLLHPRKYLREAQPTYLFTSAHYPQFYCTGAAQCFDMNMASEKLA
jgi:hypothetical protein